MTPHPEMFLFQVSHLACICFFDGCTLVSLQDKAARRSKQ